MTRNRFSGEGPTVSNHAVAESSGSQRATVTWNHASNMKALAIGNGLTVTDNCVVNVTTIVEQPGSNVTQARNTPTACGY